jgi:hypothetical protein
MPHIAENFGRGEVRWPFDDQKVCHSSAKFPPEVLAIPGDFTSFSQFMSRPTSYKKHMKHASDLFWASSTDSSPAIHWRFDESYNVVKSEELPHCDMNCMIQKTFAPATPRCLPVPRFEPETSSDSDCFAGVTECNSSSRSFLAFPDGFWSHLHSTETHVVVSGPCGFF